MSRGGWNPCSSELMSTNGTCRSTSHPLSRKTRASAALIDVNRLAVRVRREQLPGQPHRHANAAVARRVRGDGGVAVDCIAAREVHRVVEGAERAGVEADHLPVDR